MTNIELRNFICCLIIVGIIVFGMWLTTSAIVNRPRYQQQDEIAFKLGQTAYVAHISPLANPYIYTNNRVKWLNGWIAQRKIKSGLLNRSPSRQGNSP